MKKIFLISILITPMILPSLVLADMSVSLEEVLAEIMRTQGVSEKDKLDCQQITDEQFEKLGEAVMGIMHPDPTEHELMDKMMGGEGSQSLKTVHISMGKRYLGCGGEMMNGGMTGMTGMTGMMADGPMGSWWQTNKLTNKNNFNSIMGNFFNSPLGWFGFGLGWLLMILFWILIIVALLALIRWLWSGGEKPKEGTALEILKERYAKGEISKKEFEEKKRNLA